MNISFYLTQRNRKRNWLPVCGSTKTTGFADTVIGKCLSVRDMEIDVAEWVQAEMNKTPIEQPVCDVLLSNIQDETKHKTVLDMAAKNYSFLIKKEYESEAQALAREWDRLPDHPIVKAYVLENSVFFVILPLLRFYGGSSLAMVSSDISGDEAVHAAVNRQLARDLGYTYTPQLNALRKETVAWLVEDLSVPAAGRKGNKNTWIKMSDDLLEHGQSDLTETRRAIVPAFFEIPNDSLPKYS